jgi:UDP-N-acetylglucosamine--N-acetylmuramyl-(pentapeptide) pyrophosphoryl-undecaprenol N-acetylglucosamine transferase
MEAELVTRLNIPFTGIPAAGVHGVGLRSLPGNLIRLLRGALASSRILKDFQPDVLLFTGGYVAVPMALAARRLPSLLFVPDIEPGLALKVLARFASRIALTSEKSKSFFKNGKRLVVTGYPVRPELTAWTREKGRAALGLRHDAPVLLVFGGSKGARSINRALLASLHRLLDKIQVVHISGQLDWAEIIEAKKALPAELSANYHPFAYLHEEMGAALASADLAVSRAGASSLGEYPAFGLPAVLVPYPYAWRYQKVNADYLADHGAAVIVEDRTLNENFAAAVLNLLDDEQRLEAMRRAMGSLARPEAAQKIAGLLLNLASAGKDAILHD